MTLAALRTYTRRLLSELDPLNSFWGEETLTDFLNRSYEQVVSQSEILQCTSIGSVVFVAGEVHGEYAQPKDILRIIKVFYRNVLLTATTIEELDREDLTWTTKVAASGSFPTKWAPRGQIIHLVPAPSETATDVLKMWGIQTPVPLTAEDQSPEAPNGYHEAIAIGAAIRALKSDRTGPENPRAIAQLEGDYKTAIGWAYSQRLRTGPAPQAVRDIRDFYPTAASGWRS